MIVTKTITPSPFKSSIFRAEVMREMTGLHGEILNDFLKTAETWEHKPHFSGGVTMRGKIVAVDVHTSDKIYGYVSEGTRKHVIKPKYAKRLRFKWGGPGSYRSKTFTGVIGSVSGGAFGPEVFRKKVNHPGTKARKFHETIKKKWSPIFKRRLQAALNRAAQKSGHGKR